MSGKADAALAAAFIPGEAASLSALLVRAAEEREAGWPSLGGRLVSPALYDLPDDAQRIARRMAGDIRALWETAGRPHFDTPRFKDAYRWLVACVRSGSIPPVLTIGEVPPLPAPAPSKFTRNS
ncbi:hypothetical protein [Sphingomonas gellani]|nr:hypothetical protein [Sphingomonas gellani]